MTRLFFTLIALMAYSGYIQPDEYLNLTDEVRYRNFVICLIAAIFVWVVWAAKKVIDAQN
jgi:hypothetical protein